ncbi:hypothetical protein [Roseibium sp.]|uniref:hypothetical protein n=1 Tax=Roseibium sp. TaxID=1936156 RepID=UPI003B51EE9E
MDTPITDLTAFQLFWLIVAANTWFFVVLFLLRFLLGTPDALDPKKLRLIWLSTAGLILVPSIWIMLKLH